MSPFKRGRELIREIEEGTSTNRYKSIGRKECKPEDEKERAI